MELFELDINALSKGKKEAFFILYKKFFVALCLFAQKFSIEKEAAEDIVQEIFYKLYEERQIFHNILTLQSYLYSSVKNSCLNYIRDEKRRKLRESYYCDEIYNNDTTFINDVIENEVYRELYQLLDELPPQCRVIFERVLQGETSETIAKSMHLSIETVKTQPEKSQTYTKRTLQIIFNIIGIFLLIFFIYRIPTFLFGSVFIKK